MTRELTASRDFLPESIRVSRPGASPRGLAFVLHGILGSASNWRSFVRRLVDRSEVAAALDWVLVDLRAHGESSLTPAPPPHTVDACAADLARLARHLERPVDLVIGHSFGGKVALSFATEHSPATRAAWFLDTPPGPMTLGDAGTGRDDLERVLGILETIPEPLPGRQEVAERLMAQGLSAGLSQWMTTNVRGTSESGYRWKFDLAAVKALIADYARLDLWPLVEHPRPGLVVHGVRGERSTRFDPEDVARMDRIGAHVIADAGHWLHVDQPEALMRLFERAAAEVIA